MGRGQYSVASMNGDRGGNPKDRRSNTKDRKGRPKDRENQSEEDDKDADGLPYALNTEHNPRGQVQELDGKGQDNKFSLKVSPTKANPTKLDEFCARFKPRFKEDLYQPTAEEGSGRYTSVLVLERKPTEGNSVRITYFNVVDMTCMTYMLGPDGNVAKTEDTNSSRVETAFHMMLSPYIPDKGARLRLMHYALNLTPVRFVKTALDVSTLEVLVCAPFDEKEFEGKLRAGYVHNVSETRPRS